MGGAARLDGGARAFRYLESEVYALADVDEAEALRNTQDAMSIVGLPPWEQARRPQPATRHPPPDLRSAWESFVFNGTQWSHSSNPNLG